MNIIDIIDQLKHSHVFKYVPERAVVKLQGPDARDFLQRMSTNDMQSLALGHPVQTCLLNNKGRVVDYLIVMQLETASYLLISSFAEGQRLVDWLSNYHFVEDMTFASVFFPVTLVICASGYKPADAPNSLIWRSSNFDIFLSSNSPDYPRVNKKIWECLRIGSLMPAVPQEINDSFMPQNIGLGHLIADNKGCYLGQEVIAKAITYQKNVKSLAGVRLSPELFSKTQVGDRVSSSTHSGVITSLAPYYCPHIANGLALIDTKALVPQSTSAAFIFAKKA